MDYKELAKDLISGCEENCSDCKYAGDSEFECTIAKLASTAITELLARLEEAERKSEELNEALSSASKVVRTMQESVIPYYRKRAEDAEKEVDWKNKVIEAAERRFSEAEARCNILETRLETAEKMVNEYQDVIVPGYRERAEKAESERDAAVSDMENLMCNCIDGCHVCANAIVVHREPYTRLDCALKGQICTPKWRGAKDE